MRIPHSEEASIRFKNIYRDSVVSAKIQVPFDNLDNGTRILTDELDCLKYIALYGGHHFHKLYVAYASTKFKSIEGRDIEIIDWGCGQALATCVLIDYLIEKNIDINVSSITLIEPSKIALRQGRRLIQKMFQNNISANSIVRSVNKYISDLTTSDMVLKPSGIKVNLFSNIIDIEGFDLRQLHQLITSSSPGLNRIICTSPDNEQQHRLETFFQLFEKSHQITNALSSNEALYEEIFYAATGQYEKRRIGRCERQFTVNITRP